MEITRLQWLKKRYSALIVAYHTVFVTANTFIHCIPQYEHVPRKNEKYVHNTEIFTAVFTDFPELESSA